MASLQEMVRLIMLALPQLLLSSGAALLLLLALLLVYLQYRRIAGFEAELYGAPMHKAGEQTQHALLMGAMGGILGSLILSLAGVGLVEVRGAGSALLYLWPVSLLLGLLNPRLICFAYSAMVLSVSSLVIGWPRMDVPSVMGLIAVLHMVEAFLVWVSGATCATPVSIDGQRNEAVPGFILNRFWPVPLILPLFGASTGSPLAMPSWWPLLGPGLSVASGAFYGWELAPVVVTMGYTDLAISAPPEQRAQQSARLLLVYSVVLLALAAGANRFPPLLWAAALFSGLGHEAMAVWSSRVQMFGDAYLRRPGRGVGVLDVLPGSAAAAGGLRSGAVILSVDDREVNSREQLHEALLASPAYVRIMYRLGRQLEHCRVPRPAEGLFGLGAILLPEAKDRALTKISRPTLFRWTGMER